MDKLTITNAEWKTFNYEDYESGLFWLLVEAPEVDIDADDDGRTVGRYTGKLCGQLSWRLLSKIMTACPISMLSIPSILAECLMMAW